MERHETLAAVCAAVLAALGLAGLAAGLWSYFWICARALQAGFGGG
jgi:hypothetical protein